MAVRELPGSSGRLSPCFLMNKRSEAPAAVRPGPAVPFRLTAVVVSGGSQACAVSGMTATRMLSQPLNEVSAAARDGP